MANIFIFCAIVGGTILLIQMVLTCLGFVDLDMDVDIDTPDDLSFDGADAVGGGGHHGAHVADWLWGVVSFRTVIPGMAIFGVVGLAMRQSNASPSMQVTTAALSGVAAMYCVHGLMKGVQRLAQDNTINLKRAIGKNGTVYLAIPGQNQGTGKVHLVVQGRLEELEASTTSPDKLLPGAKVVVIDIVGKETLLVEPAAAEAKPTQSLAETA